MKEVEVLQGLYCCEGRELWELKEERKCITEKYVRKFVKDAKGLQGLYCYEGRKSCELEDGEKWYNIKVSKMDL